MKYISHRGNLSGSTESENHPDTIQYALSLGFDCEIDVRYHDGWYLGHDHADHPIDFEFLTQPKLWIHAKNLEALYHLSKTKLNYFWHQEDDYTITSYGYIWTYPERLLTNRSILLKPEKYLSMFTIETIDVYGICSDIIETIRDRRENAEQTRT